MPRKPTRPFGHVGFSRSGRVTKEMPELSSVKEVQELQVAARFVDSYNELNLGPQIANLRALPQYGHDTTAIIAGRLLEIQVTELVDRAYTFAMTAEEYKAGLFTEAVQLVPGARPHRIDPALRDEALWHAIQKKVRRYAPPQNTMLWLVVFSVGTLYLTEYVEAGVPKVSNALRLARTRLATSGSGPFNEIWFADLRTRPVRVWPRPSAPAE